MSKYHIADDGTVKICATCTSEKPISAYYATRPGGRTPRKNCIPCHESHSHGRSVEHQRPQRPRTPPDACNRASAWRAYGATDTEVLVLEFLYLHGTTCDVCGVPIRGPEMKVDHDHERKRIRGVLCHRHNVGLGYFDDSIDGLQRAVAYLTRHTGGASDACIS